MHTSLRHYSLQVERDAYGRRPTVAHHGGPQRGRSERKGHRRSLRDRIWAAGRIARPRTPVGVAA